MSTRTLLQASPARGCGCGDIEHPGRDSAARPELCVARAGTSRQPDSVCCGSSSAMACGGSAIGGTANRCGRGSARLVTAHSACLQPGRDAVSLLTLQLLPRSAVIDSMAWGTMPTLNMRRDMRTYHRPCSACGAARRCTERDPSKSAPRQARHCHYAHADSKGDANTSVSIFSCTD